MKIAHVWAMPITTSPPMREARRWLRGNPNPSALAANRFHTTENALTFVERLYAAGAAAVFVADPIVDADRHPYADTLMVQLPTAGDIRWNLERLCREQGPGALPPGDFTMDVESDFIRLWWD